MHRYLIVAVVLFSVTAGCGEEQAAVSGFTDAEIAECKSDAVGSVQGSSATQSSMPGSCGFWALAQLRQHERVVQGRFPQVVIAPRRATVPGLHVDLEQERMVVGLVRP